MIQAYDYEDITVAATAVGFTAGKLTADNNGIASRAICTVEDASIRFRTDGSDPTSSVGHKVTVDQTIIVTGLRDMENFRVIRAGSVSASLRVTYER